jgi:proline iminopeptidase
MRVGDSGCGAGSRRYFDPERYRMLLFDQRGCGRSTPHASDPATDMSVNTTHELGVSGGSSPWSGSASALESPRATATEIDLLAGYARLLEDPDPDVRARAAADWLAWEDAVISMEPNGRPKAYSARPPDASVAFVRICSRYFSHGAWLEEDGLPGNAARLAGIPGVLIHGRLDPGSPLGTARELAKAWPDAQLVVVDDSGHTGSDSMKAEILKALDTVAGR